MIGETISHYRITEKLGEGGMGVVYKAEDTKLRRPVALKFLPRELTRDEEANKRFVHEAQASAALDHPNICTVHEIVETEDHTFIVMPFIGGESLRRRIESGPPEVDEAIELAIQVARGLARAHENGIVHRDIKPGNILIDRDGQAKIVDFGLAKLGTQTRLTRTGLMMGTVAYMSPEQSRGTDVDHRTDIWSLGAVLYELLTGRQPFRGDYEAAIIYSILNEDPEPLEAFRPGLPPALQHVVDKALSKDPAVRYGSAAELISDLEQVKRGEEVAAAKKRRGRFPVRASLWAGMGAVAVVAVYMLYMRFGPPARHGPPPLSANVVAVFPFSFQGSTDATHMAEGVVDVLGKKLDEAADLQIVDSAALLSLVRRDGGGQLEPRRARAIAERAGAGAYITGSIVETGKKLVMRASLFSTYGNTDALAEASAEGSAGEYLRLVEDIAADILVEHFGRSVQLVGIARQATTSYPALVAYLDAEKLYRTGEYARSAEAAKRAVQADSTMALAYYRWIRANGSSMTSPDDPSSNAAEMAMRYRDRLPAYTQRLLEAFDVSYRQRDAMKGVRLLRENLTTRPDDIESRALLAELLFLYGRWQGLWQEEAEEQFKRVLSYDPDHLDAMTYLYWMTGIQERYEESAEWTRRRLRVEKGDYVPTLQMQLALAQPDTVLQRRSLDDLAKLDDGTVWGTFLAVINMDGNLRGAAQICRIQTDPSRATIWRAEGYFQMARLAVAAGRWSEARGPFATAESIEPPGSIRQRAALSITPIPAFERTLLETRPEEILKLATQTVLGSAEQRYLAGILSARLGERTAALRRAAELDSLRRMEKIGNWIVPEGWSIWFGDLAHGVRAEVLRLSGNHANALAELERIRLGGLWNNYNPGILHSLAYERYQLGTLLKEAGRLEEALRWYGTLGQVSPDGYIYLGPKHLQMGEVYERMGDARKAAQHYGRFVELWKDCDPEFRPVVEDVRARIARLNL